MIIGTPLPLRLRPYSWIYTHENRSFYRCIHLYTYTRRTLSRSQPYWRCRSPRFGMGSLCMVQLGSHTVPQWTLPYRHTWEQVYIEWHLFINYAYHHRRTSPVSLRGVRSLARIFSQALAQKSSGFARILLVFHPKMAIWKILRPPPPPFA